MNWLDKLNRRYARFSIPNLMRYIIIGMGIVFVLDLLLPGLGVSSWLMLDIGAVLSGQVWRLISFIFMPDTSNLLFLFISLYFYYFIGSALENMWGSFRFTFYYICGILATILAAFLSFFIFGVGWGSNSYLNMSLFLAFATLAPDTTFMLFFVIPVKAKWLALLDVAGLAIMVIQAFNFSNVYGLISLLGVALSLLNYLLFFGGRFIEAIRTEMLVQKNRRNWRDNNR